MANVSVVIPTYNGRALLSKHLQSVLESMRADDELVLVDDASSDDSVEWLSRHFSLHELEPTSQFQVLSGSWSVAGQSGPVTLVVNDRNERFAVSVNRGVSVAQGDLVFLLNNDVSPQKSVISKLEKRFDDDKVFAVGCLEYEQDQHGQKSGKNRLHFIRGMFIHSRAEEFERGETAWVSGGSGMFDAKKWQVLGGFDPIFAPAYWEDVDLSFRARQMGWRVLFEPEAVVYHKHESTNMEAFGQDRIEEMSWDNALRFVRKHASWWQYCQHLCWRPYWWWKRHAT
jgi:GT2 family glycosyltransferase